MDLAGHLKMASDEVKTLRNLTGLIKHDVQQMQADSASATADPAFNPFADGDTHRTEHQTTNRSNVDKLMTENESMTNQLSLTNKVKQSLETELLQAKLAHATEMQSLVNKFS